MFWEKINAYGVLATLLYLSLNALAAQKHEVVVGGPGVLQFTPPTVVCPIYTINPHGLPNNGNIECHRWRQRRLHLQAKQSHCHAVDLRESLPNGSRRVRLRIVRSSSIYACFSF